MRSFLFAAMCLVAPLLAAGDSSVESAAPYAVASGLFDESRPDLGLARPAGAETFTVFRASADTDQYCNGAALIRFKGRWYAQWQSSARDEDSADTWVAYSTSADGAVWEAPRVLAPAGEGGAMHSSGGWWTDGETLVAFVNVWPMGVESGAGGHAVYRVSTDGATWSDPRRVTGPDAEPVNGVIEQDIHAYGGRCYTAFHLQPGLIATPHFTDDPLGLGGWTAGAMLRLPFTGKTSRELEPSLFARDDGVVMVFRDQGSSYRQLASESRDGGVTWSRPALTDMPDARSKQSAGNLPDGTAFLVNCPRTTRERFPLALTLSRDGRVFDRSFLLRGAEELPALRFPGRYKRPGYHYPKSFVADDALYVIYATNKEAIEVTRVPLSAVTAHSR